MGKRKKFIPSDTTDPGRPRRKIPGPSSVMQHPSSVCHTAFLASYAQVSADMRGCPSLPFDFLPDTDSRGLYPLWGSYPTIHIWAGKAEMQWIMKSSLHRDLSSASTRHLRAGAPRYPPSSSCSNYFASSWESHCCAEGRARHPPPMQQPNSCLLQLSNSHCSDGLKPSNNLLIYEAWHFSLEMKETFTGLCTLTILYHQSSSLWIFPARNCIV